MADSDEEAERLAALRPVRTRVPLVSAMCCDALYMCRLHIGFVLRHFGFADALFLCCRTMPLNERHPLDCAHSAVQLVYCTPSS
jgi:hypothetical protein